MKKVILTILDGYGISKEKKGNAVYLADTKILDKIFKDYPHTEIKASGVDVGLPDKQMGNSEVGHMNIGAGRVVKEDLTLINEDIETSKFFDNEVLKNTILYAKNNNKKLHLIGLLSDGGVHSHINHLFAILEASKRLDFKNVYIHAILDGRDTSPTSGVVYLEKLIEKTKELKVGVLATVIGRFYAMDRDKRYERIFKAYSLYTKGIGEETKDILATIKEKYYNNTTDEFMEPIVVSKNARIEEKDAVIFYNFRPDRAREITRSLVDNDFNYFKTSRLNLYYTCMTEYAKEIKNVNIMYKSHDVKNNLGEVVSKAGLKQLRIAETEKYAHVTFFLNGGSEVEYQGETRILIPSPKDVKTYDLKPEMSAYKITERVVWEINKETYDLIVLNFANSDMVGHTGNLEACKKALEVVSECMGKILESVFEHDYAMIVTADHGNSEHMLNEDGSINTAHTNNLVPLSLINYKDVKLRMGRLADVSPTILEILGIEKPLEMTGESLIIK